MGRAARVRRFWTCPECGAGTWTNAEGIREHADQCARMKKLNLILPTIQVKEVEVDRKGVIRSD